MHANSRRVGVFFMLLLAVAGLYVPFWLQGEVFGTFDLGHITVPMEQLFARYQARGDVPAWAGEFNGGFPLMANGFQSFYYPPHMLLRAILPAIWAVNVSLLLHMVGAGAGVWLLLRQQKLGRLAAGLGALTFAVGGYFVGRITLPHLFFAAAYLPWLLWAIFRLRDAVSLGRVLVLAIIASLLVLAGHIQIVMYAAVVSLVAVTALLVKEREQLGRFGGGLLGAAGLVVLLTAVHIWPVVEHLPLSRRGETLTEIEAYDLSYPLYQVASWINPGVYGLGETYAGPKNEPEMMMYVGGLGLVLAAVAVFDRRTWRRSLGLTAVGLVVVGLVLAGGGYSTVYRYLHGLDTPLAGFANPGRAIVLVHLGLSVLVALGAQWMVLARRRGVAVAGRYAAGAALALALMWGASRAAPVESDMTSALLLAGLWAGAGWVVLGTDLLPGRHKSLVVGGLMAMELLVLAYPTLRPVSAEAFTEELLLAQVLPVNNEAPRIFSHERIIAVDEGDFGISPGPRITKVRRVEQRVVPVSDGWSAVAVDLTWNKVEPQSGHIKLEVWNTAGEMVRQAEQSAEEIEPEEPTVFVFEPIEDAAGEPFRVRLMSSFANNQAPAVYLRTNPDGDDYIPDGEGYQCQREECEALYNTDWQTDVDLSMRLRYEAAGERYVPRELLIPMFGEGEGYRMVRAHLTLQWQRLDDYLRQMGEREDFYASELLRHRDMLDRLAVGTIVAAFEPYRELEGFSDMTPVASTLVGGRQLQVYRNERAWPRLSVASAAVAAKQEEARALVFEGELEAEEVVVEGVEVPEDLGQDTGASVELLEDEGEIVEVRVESNSTQLLVLRDINLPGWRAWVNDQEVEIYPVDTIFRGVIVPSGEHTVRFAYESKALTAGSWVSAWAWLVVLGTGTYVWRYQRA